MQRVATTTETATIRAKRKTRKGALTLLATTSNEALSAAIAAMVSACELELPLAAAHSAAEEATQALERSDADPALVEKAARAEDRAERKWLRQRRLVDKAAEAVLSVFVDTPADALLKLRAYAWSYEATNCLDIWGEEDKAACLASAMRDLAALQPPAPELVAPADQEWGAALSAYQAAKAAAGAHHERYRAATDAIGAQIPDGLFEENRYGRHLQWYTLEAFDRAFPPPRQGELRAKLAAWLPRHKALEQAAGIDESEEEGEALYFAQSTAFEHLLQTRAPDAAALARKLEIWSAENDDEKQGYGDPAYLAQQRTSYLASRGPVEVYADALRLAGQPEPQGMDCSPRDWIRAYEAVGGGVWYNLDRQALNLGRNVPGCDVIAARQLENDLHAHPWLARSVWIECREDNYQTRAAHPVLPGESPGFWSWVQFTDGEGAPLSPRIHFGNERDAPPIVDEDVIAAAPDHQRGPEALRLARAI